MSKPRNYYYLDSSIVNTHGKVNTDFIIFNHIAKVNYNNYLKVQVTIWFSQGMCVKLVDLEASKFIVAYTEWLDYTNKEYEDGLV